MSKNCCKDCENRFVGCHSTCEKYAEYRQEIDRKKEETKKQNMVDSVLHRYNKDKKKSLLNNYRK